jgi:hypothetical protein
MVVLYKDVFGSLDAIPESVREWRDLSEPAVEAHVKEYVSSPDDDRAQAVFSVFGLSQMLVLLLITPIVIGIAEIRFKNLSPASIVLMSALILLLGGLDLYTGYVDFRVAAFYEARLRYERRVRALLRKPFSIFYYSAVVRWAALEFLSRAFGGPLIGEGCLIVFFSFLTLLSVFD